MLCSPPNAKDQQSPEDISQPKSHNIIFKMPRIQSKITLHTKNQESLNTEMTQMLDLSEKDLRNEKIESLNREIEDIENNQIKNFKLRNYINENLKIYWMALVAEWQRKFSELGVRSVEIICSEQNVHLCQMPCSLEHVTVTLHDKRESADVTDVMDFKIQTI